jgi:hypothetical protein
MAATTSSDHPRLQHVHGEAAGFAAAAGGAYRSYGRRPSQQHTEEAEEEAGGRTAAACGHGGARSTEPDEENWRLKKMQLER